MSSEQPQPFNVGDEVEHKCGIVGIVKACERRVVHGSTRWVIVQAWPHNCKLIKSAKTADITEAVDTILGAMQPGDVFSITKEATSSTEHAADVASAVDNLLVANLCSALVRALKFHAGGDEVLRDTFGRIIREQLAEHRPNNAEADLRERLEEATQEFARALSSAQSLTADVIGERDEARKSASGWRSVVVECQKILGMNGDTPTDPKTSAVPMRVRMLVKTFESAKSRLDKVIALLQGVE